MMDPMGDVGANVDNNAAVDATTGAYHNLRSNEIVDPLIVQMNLSRIERIRSVMGIASGCIAGILGLTGMEGFACFIILHLVVSFAIWLYKMNCNLRAYTQLSWFKYLITIPLQPTALSFTLFWTLFYGLVFLY